MFSKSLQSTMLQAGGATALLHLLKRFCILSWWVGSKTAILGVRSIVQPLLGRYMGRNAYALSSLLVMLVAVLFGSASSLLVRLTWGLPSIVAGYALRKRNAYLLLGIPVAAAALFVLHPQGGLAWQYALYWIIPAAIYVSGRNDCISRSLAATFVAHAVGSVLWLYATNMSAVLWLSLIPRVAYERGLLALSLAVAQYVIDGALAVYHGLSKDSGHSHRTTV